MRKELLKNWSESTEAIGDFFVLRYFGRDADSHWLADDIGGVLYVNDYFFDLQQVLDFLKYSYSKNKMFEYYDYQLQCNEDKKLPINIRTYRHRI